MKAPERIFLIPDGRYDGLSIFWYELPYSTGSIEYIRVDTSEVKEVDLNREIDLWIKNLHSVPNFEELNKFAKHFFELGLSVKNPNSSKKMISIDKAAEWLRDNTMAQLNLDFGNFQLVREFVDHFKEEIEE